MRPSYLTRLLAYGTFASLALGWAATSLAAPPDPGANYPFAMSQPILGRYIVVFKADVANPAAEAEGLVRAGGGRLHFTYVHALKGFAATLPEVAVQALRENPKVDYVEQDQTVALSQTSPQNGATWGLDRIDQVSLPLNTQYEFNSTGAGVSAFIIDTGILATHTEFGGRVGAGYTAISDGNGTTDCQGHGTHVAGTVGGANYGVAKTVSLIPVRVLNCSGFGSNSGVIAGVDWVAGSTVRPAVANMSLGGGYSSSLNATVAGAVAKGVTMVVAAGNDASNACNKSPASEPSALTVGATTSADARASYSNYGTCLDIFAPGSSITSSWFSSTTAINTISGTSMATPHVAGVVALVLSTNPSSTPAAVGNFLKSGASVNKVSSAGTGSPNLLVYSLASGSPVEPKPVVLAVQSMTGRSAKVFRGWRAYATVTMRDVNSGLVKANVTVKGVFAPGSAVSCVTGSAGSCTLTSGVISTTTTATSATVTGAAGTGMTYDASQNAVSSILISRP